jgi:hypothetical protein
MNAATKQDILNGIHSAAETNRVYGKMGVTKLQTSSMYGKVLTKETREFILEEVERGVTAIEVTPTAVIRHFDFRSKYPAGLALDAPIPYTLTDKAREYFESGKKA